MASTIYNCLALAVCTDGLVRTCSLALPSYLIKGGQFQFFTNLSLLVTVAYYAVDTVFTAVFTPSNTPIGSTRPSWLNVFHHLCLSLEFAVTVTYWTLYFGFSHLLNQGFDVDLRLDLEIHLIPFVVLLGSRRSYARVGRTTMLAVVGAFLAAYWTYIETIYAGDTVFPYPFLSDKTLAQRLLWLGWFMALATASIFASN